MSDTAVLGAVVGALWLVALGLVGVVWSMLRGKVDALDARVRLIEIEAATQRTRADGHDNSFEQLRNAMQRIERKLDRALGVRGSDDE